MESVAPLLGPVVPLSPGSVQVKVRGGAGQTCLLQSSTDLVNWTVFDYVALDDNGMGLGTASFTISSAAGLRFYRALAVAPPVAP